MIISPACRPSPWVINNNLGGGFGEQQTLPQCLALNVTVTLYYTPSVVLMHPCSNADACACTAVSDGDRVALTSMKFASDKSAGKPAPHLPELEHKPSLPLVLWMAAMHPFCGTSRAPMLSQFMPSRCYMRWCANS